MVGLLDNELHVEVYVCPAIVLATKRRLTRVNERDSSFSWIPSELQDSTSLSLAPSSPRRAFEKSVFILRQWKSFHGDSEISLERGGGRFLMNEERRTGAPSIGQT